MSKANNVYCNVGDVPKKKKRGSMKECAEKGQIYYWGQYKADKKMVELSMDRKKGSKNTVSSLEKEKSKIRSDYMGVRGKLNKINKDIPYIQDKTELKDKKKEKESVEKIAIKMQNEMNKIDEKIKKLKGGKRKSKKRSSKK